MSTPVKTLKIGLATSIFALTISLFALGVDVTIFFNGLVTGEGFLWAPFIATLFVAGLTVFNTWMIVRAWHRIQDAKTRERLFGLRLFSETLTFNESLGKPLH